MSPFHKLLFLLLFFLLHSNAAYSLTYYSTGSFAANVLSSWNNSRSGIGTAPPDFDRNDTFIIQASHIMHTTSHWKLNGTFAAILIESNAILKATDSITLRNTAACIIKNRGSYHHMNKSLAQIGIFNGAEFFEPASNVEIIDWYGFDLPIPVEKFGNLKISYAPSKAWNQRNTIREIQGNFLLDNSSSEAFQFAADSNYTINIGKNLIIRSGLFQFCNETIHTYRANIKGGFIQSGGSVIHVAGYRFLAVWTLCFMGDSSFFYRSGGTYNSAAINYEVARNTNMYYAPRIPVRINRSFQLYGTLFCDNKIIFGRGSFVLNDDASIWVGADSGLSKPRIRKGNIQTYNKYYAQIATYNYYGYNHQISGNGIPDTIQNLNIKMHHVYHRVCLSHSIHVKEVLTLDTGIVYTDTFVLSLGENAIQPGWLNHNRAFVDGSFARIFQPMINSGITGLMPVGNDTFYRPAQVDFTRAPSIGGMLLCRFVNMVPGNAGLGLYYGSLYLANTSDSGYWKLDVMHGNFDSSSYNIKLFPNYFMDIANPLQMYIVKRDSTLGLWYIQGTRSVSIGVYSSMYVQHTNMSGFGQYAIIRSTNGDPLPVSWDQFDVKPINNDALLQWSTNLEINNDYFAVLRSTDAIHFDSIGRVKGKGNSTEWNQYTWIDSDIDKLNVPIVYYRIKQVDFDAQFSVSVVKYLRVQKKSSDIAFAIYPNPAMDYIQIESNKKWNEVQLYTNEGKLICKCYTNRIQVSDLPGASYFIRVLFDNGDVFTQTFIKQ